MNLLFLLLFCCLEIVAVQHDFPCCSCWTTEFSALAGWWWWSKRVTKAFRHLFVWNHIQSRNPSASVKRLLRLRAGTFIQLQLHGSDFTDHLSSWKKSGHISSDITHTEAWKAAISNLIKRKKRISQILREPPELHSIFVFLQNWQLWSCLGLLLTDPHHWACFLSCHCSSLH